MHCPLLPYSLPVWKAFTLGVGSGFGLVAQPFQGAVHQLLVLPRQPAEQQRGVPALVGREVALDGFVECVCLLLGESCLLFQAAPFLFDAPADDFLQIALRRRRSDLHQVPRNHVGSH